MMITHEGNFEKLSSIGGRRVKVRRPLSSFSARLLLLVLIAFAMVIPGLPPTKTLVLAGGVILLF